MAQIFPSLDAATKENFLRTSNILQANNEALTRLELMRQELAEFTLEGTLADDYALTALVGKSEAAINRLDEQVRLLKAALGK